MGVMKHSAVDECAWPENFEDAVREVANLRAQLQVAERNTKRLGAAITGLLPLVDQSNPRAIRPVARATLSIKAILGVHTPSLQSALDLRDYLPCGPEAHGEVKPRDLVREVSR